MPCSQDKQVFYSDHTAVWRCRCGFPQCCAHSCRARLALCRLQSHLPLVCQALVPKAEYRVPYKFSVFLVAVDGVGQNSLRPAAVPLPILLRAVNQCDTFVEIIKALVVDEGKTVNNGKVQLLSKLNRRSRLAPTMGRICGCRRLTILSDMDFADPPHASVTVRLPCGWYQAVSFAVQSVCFRELR